jgi:hypothetical protein
MWNNIKGYHYGKRGCIRGRVTGCIGGLVGMPLMCCCLIAPLYYVNENNLNIIYGLIPFVLAMGALGLVAVIVLIVSMSRGKDGQG